MATATRLTSEDVTNTKTRLHEAIPLTGSIPSGTYGTFPDENNIKSAYAADSMIQSVYDYPYLSSSANHIFDLSVGAVSSFMHTATVQLDDKTNMYNQMALMLVGADETGSIYPFDFEGRASHTETPNSKIESAYFLSFSRLLIKDEIEKGSFSMTVNTGKDFDDPYNKGATATAGNSGLVITDASASTKFFNNSPVGEYGELFLTNESGSVQCGLIYYQAGIVVLNPSGSWSSGSLYSDPSVNGVQVGDLTTGGTHASDLPYEQHFMSASITGAADALRNRIGELSFRNTTEINSTIYFCRASHNQYNYSSNPTYLTASKPYVKRDLTDSPVSYITTVGLYGPQDELLAVAKLSEPLKKTPETELTLRVRLDY